MADMGSILNRAAGLATEAQRAQRKVKRKKEKSKKKEDEGRRQGNF